MTWAVVQTEAQREQAARRHLMRDGFTCYLPQIRIVQRIAALFPGYLFVSMAGDQWYQIAWTPHVVRLLMAGDRPAELGETIIAEIRKRERNGFVMLPQMSRRFRRGQDVRVVKGSFEGRIGIYDGMNGRDRERVLLELLGRQVRIELASEAIEPLDIVATPIRARY